MKHTHLVFLFDEEVIDRAAINHHIVTSGSTLTYHKINPVEELVSDSIDPVEAFLTKLNSVQEPNTKLITRQQLIDVVIKESGSYPFIHNQCLFVPGSVGSACAIVPVQVYETAGKHFHALVLPALENRPNTCNLLKTKPNLQLVKK